MPETVSCPNCTRRLAVPPHLLGTSVQCPACQTIFEATLEGAARPTPPPPPAPVEPPRTRPRDDDDDDDAPRRSRRRYEDEDDDYDRRRRPRRRGPLDYDGPGRPHRGPVILTLGILGLVLSCCYPAGWILGGIALSMGSTDTNEMDRGRMDPEGRGMTTAGKICGMIGVILAFLALFVHMALMNSPGGFRF
jgi:hypothetical protein